MAAITSPFDAGVRREIFIPDMDLPRLIDEAIIKYGDNVCTEFMGQEKTYAQIGRDIARAAKGLQDLGVKPGDKVGLYMPNTPYYPVMYFAALKIGATVVNYDLTNTAEKLAAQVKDSETSVMVVTELPEFFNNLEGPYKDGDLRKIVRCPIAGELPFLKSLGYQFKAAVSNWRGTARKPDINPRDIVEYRDIIDHDEFYSSPEIRPDDVAVLQYTGGTTGTPKGVVLTHRNLVANMLQTKEFYSMEGKAYNPDMLEPGREGILAALPFFHVYSMTVSMLMGMYTGSKLVILPNPRDLKTIVNAINDKGVTLAPLVPAQIQKIVEKKAELPDFHFGALKAVVSGGAKLKRSVRETFEKATGVIIYQGYGMSETSPIQTAQSPLVDHNDPDSVGYPVSNTDILLAEIQDAHDMSPLKRVAHGEAGEICVSGPQVMKEYWKNPAESAKVLREAEGKIWLRTGDIGVCMPDGQLKITDRIKDMIIINGKKVFPEEVEGIITAAMPEVAECALVGVPDKSAGEAAMCFIRFNPGVTVPEVAALRKTLEDILSHSQAPKYISIQTEELPKTSVNKMDKKVLRVMANDILGKDKPAAPLPAGPTL